MAKFSVGYVVFCEWLFALLVGGFGLGLALEVKTAGDIAVISSFVAFGLMSLAASFLLLTRKRWAWQISMVFGVVVVAFGAWIVWLASRSDPHGDGSEAGIFGVGFLLFASPGLILLGLPVTHQYVTEVSTSRVPLNP